MIGCGVVIPSCTNIGDIRSVAERWVSCKRSLIAGLFLSRLSLTIGKAGDW
jgi:hypothetical protein